MREPLLSIVTVNLNNKLGLRSTIRSVLEQSFKNFEYLIIDGGSSDGSVETIKEYSNSLSYWVSEADRGIYNAMNKGVNHCRGQYVLFLNSGDYLLEGVLAKVFNKIRTADFVYGDYLMLNEKGQYYRKEYPENPTMLTFFSSTLPHGATFHKRELFRDSCYDEDHKVVSDWEFFIKKIVFLNCSVEKLDFAVTCFDGNGISESPKTKELNFKEREEVLKSLIPDRILTDLRELERLKKIGSTRLFQYLSEVGKTKGLQRFVLLLLKLVLKAYELVIK